ncbi:putative Serine carboxypeptidase S28-domain-containing protein [Seiridium unicorne]|uniref:Serine carboxypeptidase S28-domain-containing protein n=1 Tax=Seiridium unicorne TaxID=138068 RepID=A0ABR2V556_9PEZI
MKYLTLDNVMADAFNFINMIQTTTTGAVDSKTIVASGPYGGFLATAFRQIPPDTFFGSIAATAPVTGFVNSTNPDTFYWWDYISKIYREEPSFAAEKISKGFAEILQRASSNYVPLKSSNFAKGTIFALQINASDYFDAYCQQTYNSTSMSQTQIWNRYLLSPDDLRNSSRIVFSLAQYDPTTALASSYVPQSADVCASKYLYVSGMGHREDLFYPDPTDKYTVSKARDIELRPLHVGFYTMHLHDFKNPKPLSRH